MLKNKKILVAGGDLRNLCLAKLLSHDNTVYTIGFEKADMESTLPKSAVDYIILPTPAADENLEINSGFSVKPITIEEILEFYSPSSYVLGGKIPLKLKQLFISRNISFADYLDREELAVSNAVLTAEGAVQIAMEELPITISGAKTLVTGYGRIGKTLSARLHALGADVSVSARRFSDIAWIEAQGMKSLYTEDLQFDCEDYDIIFNTIPARIFDYDLLCKLKKDVLLIDLASKPGGVDLEAAKQLCVKVIWALSLPGKTAPVTAGKIIFDAVNNIDKERGSSFE